MTSLPIRVARAIAGGARKWRVDREADRFDARYAALGPLAQDTAAPAILVDGLWDNPNHFFRLRTFLDAIPDSERGPVVAVLRTRRDRTRRTLAAFGISRFEYIEETPVGPFEACAAGMLAGCRTHADILTLELPDGIPAYVYYDTVLKVARHPQPPLADPVWRRVLAIHLRDIAFARETVARHAPDMTVLSHPWKSEYAALLWTALGAGAPTFHLTGYCEAIRIRRFRDRADYLVPVEHLSWHEFSSLPPSIRTAIVEIGERYLSDRARGTQTDINARLAYRPDLRVADRNAARKALAGRTDRPVVLVSAHVWYDFPHTFGMRNFTDFKDWMDATIAVARRTTGVTWLLKPHPAENWYGKFSLESVAGDLPEHVRLLPVAMDTATALLASDVVVTVHGTITIEAAARGIRVLAGDRSCYSGWPIAREASSRAEYESMLSGIADLPPLASGASAYAAASAALTLAPPPADAGALRISCDSGGNALLGEIGGRLGGPMREVAAEARRIARFLGQDEFDSYAAFNLVETLRARVESGSPITLSAAAG